MDPMDWTRSVSAVPPELPKYAMRKYAPMKSRRKSSAWRERPSRQFLAVMPERTRRSSARCWPERNSLAATLCCSTQPQPWSPQDEPITFPKPCPSLRNPSTLEQLPPNYNGSWNLLSKIGRASCRERGLISEVEGSTYENPQSNL